MPKAPRVYVDGLLVNWGERWDWSPQHRAPAGNKKSSAGIRLTSSAPARPPLTPQDARRNLEGFARHAPQVMVKISGGGKGMRRIMAHLEYITRNGRLMLEDDRGGQLLGRDDLRELGDVWAHKGYPIPDESHRRESFHVVLSMPAGTDPTGVLQAARRFAAAQFGGNFEYAMALHTFATDPDPKPSRHPHVHLVVKAQGRDGTRLNPRKADLQDWREGFAAALRDHGIEAIATRRRGRLQREKGESQAVRHLKGRGVTPKRLTTEQPQQKAVERARDNAVQSKKDFAAIARALAASEDRADRGLALDLVNRLRELNGPVRDTDRKPERGRPRGEEGATRSD